MYAQCPNCQTVFNIGDAQLQAAAGQVRCGTCQETFNAFEHLLDRLPGESPPAPPLPEEPEAAFDPDLDLASALDTQELMGGLGVGGTPSGGATSPMEETMIQSAPATGGGMGGGLLDRLKLKIPGLSSAASGGRQAPAAVWVAGMVLMVALLPIQFAYFNHQQLASAKPGLRPALEGLCAVAGCEIPARRDIHSLSLADRQVRSHPDSPGALLLQGTLTNKAPFRQPYPVLEVTLSSLNGQPVALRRFYPAEYLVDSDTDIDAGIAPRGFAPLRLEVADPGDKAVSFAFDFL